MCNVLIIIIDKATPTGTQFSGQGLSQVKRQVGGLAHYVIIDLVNKTTKIQVAHNVVNNSTPP